MAIKNKKVKFDGERGGSVISFSNNDYPKGFDYDHENPLVIIATIHNYVVKRILVDQGSLVDILYNVVVANTNITKANLKPHRGNVIGVFGKLGLVEGIIKLRVIIGT